MMLTAATFSMVTVLVVAISLASTFGKKGVNSKTRTGPKKENQKYCNVTCHHHSLPHTLCKYKGPNNDFDNVTTLYSSDVSNSVLEHVNKLRNEAAYGKLIRELPLAANMREMQWNKELAKSALMWAQQCKSIKDECRDLYLEPSDDGATFAQQLIHKIPWNRETFAPYPSFKSVLQEWEKGKQYFPRKIVYSYRHPPDKNKDYSSFVQLIWANTYAIGCAAVLCTKNRSNIGYNDSIVFVCNFAPGGLEVGKSIYLPGGGCTKCKRIRKNSDGGTYCSKEYTHLCSEYRMHVLQAKNISTSTIKFINSNQDQLANLYRTKQTNETLQPFFKKHLRQRMCNYKCAVKGTKHTLCEYESLASVCKDFLQMSFNSSSLLALHNELRANIAAGRTGSKKKHTFPVASNMRLMVWDKELASSALLWAKQCQPGVIDNCRDKNFLTKHPDFKLQNGEFLRNLSGVIRTTQLVAFREFSTTDPPPTVDNFFEDWKAEFSNFPVPLIRNYKPQENLNARNFMQLVWARTYMVGCSFVTYRLNATNATNRIATLICNYAPRGGIEAHSVYTVGGPCNGCEPLYKSGKQGLYCSRNYPALCDTSHTPLTFVDLKLLAIIVLMNKLM